MRPGGPRVHSVSFGSRMCVLGVVGFIRGRCVHSVHPGAVGLIPGSRVHSCAPCGSSGSFRVVGFTRVRLGVVGGRRVYAGAP